MTVHSHSLAKRARDPSARSFFPFLLSLILLKDFHSQALGIGAGVGGRSDTSHGDDPNDQLPVLYRGFSLEHENNSGTNKPLKHKGNPRRLRIPNCDYVFKNVLKIISRDFFFCFFVRV